MDALRQGGEPDRTPTPMNRFAAAATQDAEVFPAFVETIMRFALPQEAMQRPPIRDRVERYGDTVPAPVPGPDRRLLVRLIGA